MNIQPKRIFTRKCVSGVISQGIEQAVNQNIEMTCFCLVVGGIRLVYVSIIIPTELSCCFLAVTPSLIQLSNIVLAQEEGGRKSTVLTLVPEYKDQITANFNPYSTSSMATTHEFIFEPLIIFNTRQNNQPEYRLATGYKLDDELSGVLFTLLEGVQWVERKPFTVDDILFSFPQVKNIQHLIHMA